ncbi:MAG: polysaccharide biosynthesis protein [Acidimicrobiia bacterium]|nr:polysaccharide biosynthesis protein [Acidimicrobiia bacterium]
MSFAIIDAFLISLAYLAALELRYLDQAGGVPSGLFGSLFTFLPIAIAVHIFFNIVFGSYGHVWEYASIAEAKLVAVSTVIATSVNLTLVMAYRALFDQIGPVPLGTVIWGGLLALFGMGLVRFRSRLFSFRREYGEEGPQRSLIIGTGRSAADFARYAAHAAQPTEVVGFVSVNAGAGFKRLAGLPVVGPLNELPELIEHHRIDQVIVSEGGARLARQVLDQCLWVDVALRIMPDIDTVLAGESTSTDPRDLEITDLLPRPTVSTDLDPVAELIRGKQVLVTGAGGSIGSEIVRQLLMFDPETLYAVDRDESALHESMLMWTGVGLASPKTVLCDIRDRDRVRRVFEECRPQVVFHAAALKHVPILQHYPEEAVKTNILGTVNVMDAGRDVAIERFINISTDKAVAPSSVMGATKRIAEMLMQSANTRGDGALYSSVRFGNVLGSRGSVVPTFIRQIQNGGPVTITDPDMTRYFMTVDEAVQLVLQASAMAQGGEIFVLDMGEPVRIGDLAHRMIRLAGLVPGRDIELKVTGRRPGEKMQEILSWEPLQFTEHPKVGVARPGFPGPVTVLDTVDLLKDLAGDGDSSAVTRVLRNMACKTWKGDEVVDLRSLEGDLASWN